MAERARDLDQVQQWMQSVIVHPDGALAGVRSEAARRHMDVSVDHVDDVVRPSRRQTSLQRLQIYANAYYLRLLECLREEFPALLHALGRETFDAFAFGYLQKYPSQSYTLANLGNRLPQYLAETRPADAASEDGGPNWADFLIDLATLERTYSEVFDGHGVEGKTTTLTDDLAAIPQERWPEARLVPAPCLRLLSLQYPVHEYVSAVRQDKEKDTTIPTPAPTWLVVTRREFVVRRSAVSRTEFDLLQTLVAGETIGVAVERLAATPGVESETLAADLHRWFYAWAAAGFFLSVELPT